MDEGKTHHRQHRAPAFLCRWGTVLSVEKCSPRLQMAVLFLATTILWQTFGKQYPTPIHYVWQTWLSRKQDTFHGPVSKSQPSEGGNPRRLQSLRLGARSLFRPILSRHKRRPVSLLAISYTRGTRYNIIDVSLLYFVFSLYPPCTIFISEQPGAHPPRINVP